MTLVDDGDLIRGLGYVALYSAYLEEAIDEVFSATTAANEVHHPKMNRWQVSRKLDHIGQSISGWTRLPDELTRFITCIDPLKALLERRNLIVHGRIYSDPRTGDVLKPARAGYPEIPARSADLYDLANELFAARNPCLNAAMFAIPRYARVQIGKERPSV
jgi:hypothetical protein